MRGIKILVVLLALGILAVHFVFTDPLRNSRVLELQVPDGGHSMIDDTPAQRAETEAVEKPARQHLDEATATANRERLWAGVTKWVGIGLTVILMMMAGFQGIAISAAMAQKPEEMIAEMGKHKRVQVWATVISAGVAATTLIASNLESEHAAAVGRAKEIQGVFYAAHKQWRDAKTPSEHDDAKQAFDKLLTL